MLLRMTTTSLKEMILVALTFVIAISGQNHYIDQVRGEAKIMIKTKDLETFWCSDQMDSKPWNGSLDSLRVIERKTLSS